jgi:hypothetical protein
LTGTKTIKIRGTRRTGSLSLLIDSLRFFGYFWGVCLLLQAGLEGVSYVKFHKFDPEWSLTVLISSCVLILTVTIFKFFANDLGGFYILDGTSITQRVILGDLNLRFSGPADLKRTEQILKDQHGMLIVVLKRDPAESVYKGLSRYFWNQSNAEMEALERLVQEISGPVPVKSFEKLSIDYKKFLAKS